MSKIFDVSPTLMLDLDGTLVDSVPDLAAALNRLMAERGLSGFTHAETALMVGDGVQRLVERAFDARSARMDEAAVRAFTEDYGRNFACATRLYPGAAETLDLLHAQGWRLAVCTNKLERPARALLSALGIADRFAALGGGDSFAVRKPDPGHLLATLQAAGGTPACAVSVGDHRNDVAAAHAAGVPCVFASWGYGPAEMATGAEAVAASWPELPQLAARVLRESASWDGHRNTACRNTPTQPTR